MTTAANDDCSGDYSISIVRKGQQSLDASSEF